MKDNFTKAALAVIAARPRLDRAERIVNERFDELAFNKTMPTYELCEKLLELDAIKIALCNLKVLFDGLSRACDTAVAQDIVANRAAAIVELRKGAQYMRAMRYNYEAVRELILAAPLGAKKSNIFFVGDSTAVSAYLN